VLQYLLLPAHTAAYCDERDHMPAAYVNMYICRYTYMYYRYCSFGLTDPY
jgi:hypothetical protein